MNPFEIYIRITNTCHNKEMCKERSIKEKKDWEFVFKNMKK
jgi:hypothetical protein